MAKRKGPRRSYCLPYRMEDGGIAYVRQTMSKSELPDLCWECGCVAHYLCDYIVRKDKGKGSKTCDAALCSDCRHEMAPGVDLCPAHKKAWDSMPPEEEELIVPKKEAR